jgi:hypothetical protein
MSEQGRKGASHNNGDGCPREIRMGARETEAINGYHCDEKYKERDRDKGKPKKQLGTGRRR